MDYIILISYFYATIPNFLSIICFELIKKKNMKTLSLKIENFAKSYGIFSYLFIVIAIIIFSSANNPEHTNAFLTWFK